jgi:hypothetical protein
VFVPQNRVFVQVGRAFAPKSWTVVAAEAELHPQRTNNHPDRRPTRSTNGPSGGRSGELGERSDIDSWEDPMRTALIVALTCAVSRVTTSQTTATAAATDALQPKYDFSLSRDERIRLAEGAAPPEVSGKATVYVLARSGYEKVRDGTNGFTCLVDRQDPLNMEPSCFDAEGSAAIVPSRLWVEEQRAKGRSEADINAEVDQRFKSGTYHAPHKGGIVYMMAEHVYVVGPSRDRFYDAGPHLMFYAPYATDTDIGSPHSAADMPVVLRPGRPDAYIAVHPRLVQSH